jgi:hypothetical protein
MSRSLPLCRRPFALRLPQRRVGGQTFRWPLRVLWFPSFCLSFGLFLLLVLLPLLHDDLLPFATTHLCRDRCWECQDPSWVLSVGQANDEEQKEKEKEKGKGKRKKEEEKEIAKERRTVLFGILSRFLLELLLVFFHFPFDLVLLLQSNSLTRTF